MNTRKIAAEYRLAHWARITQERNASGLSVRMFCSEAGIHENTYYYWQRKLREAACTELALPETGRQQNLIPPGWAQVEPSEPKRPHGALTIEVGGCRIAVDAETDLDLLTKVCRMLTSQ